MADGSHSPVKPKRGRGRPTDYTPEIAQAICEHIAQGKSLAAWCRENDAASYATIMRWLQEHEDFQENYERAREDSADADADMMNDLRDRILTGEIDPQAGRVAMDAIKWSAGKRNPKRYGDKVLHAGADGGALQIEQKRTLDISLYSPEERETLRVLLELGRQRQLALESGQVIEGECREVSED